MSQELLPLLVERAESRREALEKWYRSHAAQVRMPLYASVDIRNAGYKMAVVDTNIFPAGFNNISEFDHPLAARRFAWALDDRLSPGDPVLILPENHTRNLFYLQNVRVLSSLLAKAGFSVRIGSPDPEFPELEQTFLDAGDQPVTLCRLRRQGNRIEIEKDGWQPKLIVCNNDFTVDWPDFFRGLEQPILPSPQIGWHARQKKDHFEEMNRLLVEMGDILDIDPWRLYAETTFLGGLNFQEKDYEMAGLDRLAARVDELTGHVRFKYEQYGVKEDPFVFVKSNHGTYGMNIMTLASGAELREINRKQRNKMAVGKSSTETHEVIIQEGVPTRDRIGDCVGEPCIYMVAGEVVGAFFRTNCGKSDRDNLNAGGQMFITMCMSRLLGAAVDCAQEDPNEHAHLVAYGWLARAASLACGYELKAIESR